MSQAFRALQTVPGGMLGAGQWYTRPDMKQRLALEIALMRPIVGEPRWGVNCGTLSDGRMYWRVKQRIRANRRYGPGVLYDRLYDIFLVYEPDHASSQKWGTTVHAYLRGPNDLTRLQELVDRSPREPKRINHVLRDEDGRLYLCIANIRDFGVSPQDPGGAPTAKTAYLCTIKWLHNFECGLLDQTHWEKFQQEGAL